MPPFSRFAFDGESLVAFARQGSRSEEVVVFSTSDAWNTATESDLPVEPSFRVPATGMAAAVDDDIVVIGTTTSMSPDCAIPSSRCSTGTVRVYGKTNDDWNHIATLGDDEGPSGFGTAVAVDGNIIVVGAPRGSRGAAYVFVKPRGPRAGWKSTSRALKLSAPESDFQYFDGFGSAVAVDGDTVVVGAPYLLDPTRRHAADRADERSSGAVYVFKLIESPRGWTTITPPVKLTPPESAQRYWFGKAVAVEGDTIVVGAHNGNNPFSERPGAAFVFTRPSDGWRPTSDAAELTAVDATAEDFFGQSVSVSGCRVAIGSSSGGYLFTKPIEGWKNTSNAAKFVASGAVGTAHTVGLHENTVVASADGGLYLFVLNVP